MTDARVPFIMKRRIPITIIAASLTFQLRGMSSISAVEPAPQSDTSKVATDTIVAPPQRLERRFGAYYGPIPEESYSIETRSGDIVTKDVIDHHNATRDPAPYFEFGQAQNQFGFGYGYGLGYGIGPWAGYGWRGVYGFGMPFYRTPFGPYGYRGFGAVNGYGYPRGFGWAGYPYGFFPGGPYQGFFGPGMMPGYRTYGPYTGSVIVPHNPLAQESLPPNVIPQDGLTDPQIIHPNNATPLTAPQPSAPLPPPAPENPAPLNILPGPSR